MAVPRSGPSSVCKRIAHGRRDSDRQGGSHIRPMDTIAITPAAFASIAEARPDGKGGYLITLPHGA